MRSEIERRHAGHVARLEVDSVSLLANYGAVSVNDFTVTEPPVAVVAKLKMP